MVGIVMLDILGLSLQSQNLCWLSLELILSWKVEFIVESWYKVMCNHFMESFHVHFKHWIGFLVGIF